jgi:riboflavin kinase/FMN adenylyltransferase
MVKSARRQGFRSILITFEPHPRLVLKNPNSQPTQLLTTFEEKRQLLGPLGLDVLLVIEFNEKLASTTPQEFVKNFLVKKLGMADIVIGYDHGFGKNRKGTIDTLLDLAYLYGFGVEVTEEQLIDGKHVSSTIIRNLINSGDIESANQLLSVPYLLTGLVVEGAKLGRTIGFPTANINDIAPHKLIPANGVYIADVMIENVCYRSMMNIGYKPTVTSKHELTIEAHVLNYNGELYGKKLLFSILKRIRDEIKFSSLDALKTQLEKDRNEAKAFKNPFACLNS